MSDLRPIRAIFLVAALYDGILGAVFLLAPSWAFQHWDVTPPNHAGYVQFPAALLIIFAIMFAAIARDPVANRNCIFYGILLKIAYSGIVFAYWFTSAIPIIWKPFAVIDLVFLGLFIGADRALKQSPKRVEA